LSKLILKGKKHLVERHSNKAFIALKFIFKKLPATLLLKNFLKFRPVLTYANKRMGRRYNPVPLPINERRQHILALRYLAKDTMSASQKKFNERIQQTFNQIFSSDKNQVTRKFAADIKHLTESRVYLHYR
jgi:ribosomal protein S7